MADRAVSIGTLREGLEDIRDLVTVQEAAEMMKLHEDTLYAWVRKGVLPCLRVGPRKAIRLRPLDLRRVVQ